MPKSIKSNVNELDEFKKSSDVESSDTSDDHGEKRYHVEVIKAVRPLGYDSGVVKKKKKGKKPIYKEYLVKWANYSSDDNTWEPEQNVAGCQRLLESLWKHLGMRADDYTGGSILIPSDKWIDGEKNFFAKQYRDKQLRREKKKRDEKEKEKAGRSSSRNSPEPGSSSDDDLLIKVQPLKITIPSHTKRKRIESPPSSDDEPLINQKRVKLKPQIVHATSSVIPSSPIHSTSGLFSDDETETTSVPAKPTLRTLPQKAPEARIPNKPTLPAVPVGGISTKQRLAQGALAPVLPKDLVNPKTKANPLPHRTNSSSSQLIALRFKKQNQSVAAPSSSGPRFDATPTTPLQSPIVNEPTLASLNYIQSPGADHDLFQDNINQDPMATSPDRPVAQNDIFTHQTIPELFPQSEADIFLQSIMPPEMAGPLRPPPEKPFEVAPPKALRAKLPPIPRIPKIWKWNGPIYLGHKKEQLFEGELKHQLVDEHSIKFSHVFPNIESIEITKMYDNTDMLSNIHAFKKPQQIGLLTSVQEKDREAFTTLVSYLRKKQQFFMVPVILDGNAIGQIIFFPWSNEQRFPLNFNHLDLPPDINPLKGDQHLLAVLLIYALSPGQIEQAGLKPPASPAKSLEPFRPREKDIWEKLLRSKPMFHHGVRILGFTKKFFEYIADYPNSRGYIVWSQKNGLETRCLLSVLEQTRAKNLKPNQEARMVFCHVSALETFYRMPHFAERRATQPIVQFYTYGTHEDVPTSLWSIREIFPLGGVVTFTPSAMQLDMLGIINLIRRLDAHPLWCAYILPAALGVLAKMECGNSDPVAIFNKGKLGMAPILAAIEEGSVALISAPPKVTDARYDTSLENDPSLLENWQIDHFDLSPPTQGDALAKGIKAFVDNQSLLKAEASTRTTMIETDIVNDMLAMQMQPTIMTNYRRYVIIDSKEGIQAKNCGAYVSGMEWTTMEKFDFNDEFYPRNTIVSSSATAPIPSPATAPTK